MNAALRARVAWAVFGAWFVALTVLSSIPGERFGEQPFNFADKVVHVALFFVGAVPLTVALLARQSLMAGGFLALGVMLGVAVLDEFHQLFTPGRSGMDIGDLSADAIGGALGVGCVLLLHARRRQKTNLRAAGADRAA